MLVEVKTSMASENENLTEEAHMENFSLESILAEYKGSAFINGDKKTPPDILNEKAERIVREAVGRTTPAPRDSTGGVSGAADMRPDADERPGKRASIISDAPGEGSKPQQDVPNTAQRPVRERTDEGNKRRVAPNENAVVTPVRDKPAPHNKEEKDSVLMFFENYRSPVSESHDTIVQEVEKAIQRELGFDEDIIVRKRRDPVTFIDSGADGSELGIADEEIFEEPDLRDATEHFAEDLNSISLRCIPAALITITMVILTFAFEAGSIIPFGIGRSQGMAAGTLMLGLLIIMILCIDLIIRGAMSLIHGTPNVETLMLFSCTFSLLSAAFSLITNSSEVLPYCAVSAFSLTCAAIGERYNLRAITETLKTAAGSTEPFGVQAEYNHDIDKSVLKKAHKRTDGFYNNLMHSDVVETAYRFATPVLLAAALILSIFAAVFRGQGEYFLHILSALFAAAAPFSAVLAFAAPFSMIARTIRRSGAAIAGWGGADDICFTDGACVTDDDLFPPGTLSLNGLKLYEGVSPEKAIRYTASLIIASGSGLSHTFSELLKSQGMCAIKVEDFTCYEGGIGALVRGERVATGSAGFMSLLGFRIPDDMNMKNAVYTAVNDKLIAVFAVNYTPANSVQSALISILKWRIKIFFAVRDFNVTPSMLEQKFRVSLEDFAYVQAKDSYSISDSYSGKEGRMAAILVREGFGPFAEAVAGGRLLKSAALVATAVSIISAALGIIIMFYMCWSGAFFSARPGNLMVFMLSMLAAVLVVCGYVKCRK